MPAGEGDVDWVDADRATRRSLPAGFVDEFLDGAQRARTLGVERAQPAHTGGPDGGPPVTERLTGVFARERRGGRRRCRCSRFATGRRVDRPGRAGRRHADRRSAADRRPARTRCVTATCATSSCPRRRRPRARCPAQPRARRPVDQRADRDLRAPGAARALPRGLLRADAARRRLRGRGRRRRLRATTSTAAVIERVRGRAAADRGSGSTTPGAARRRTSPCCWRAASSSCSSTTTTVPAPDLLERAPSRLTTLHPGEGDAILGHTDWAPELDVTPLMHYLTEVDRMLFAYGNLDDGQQLDWRGFWEGRISSKRVAAPAPRAARPTPRLLDRRGDGLAACRARASRSSTDAAARSFMARPIDFETFCAATRPRAGRRRRSHASTTTPRSASTPQVEGAAERWEEAARRARRTASSASHELEADAVDDPARRLTSCIGATARSSGPQRQGHRGAS